MKALETRLETNKGNFELEQFFTIQKSFERSSLLSTPPFGTPPYSIRMGSFYMSIIPEDQRKPLRELRSKVKCLQETYEIAKSAEEHSVRNKAIGVLVSALMVAGIVACFFCFGPISGLVFCIGFSVICTILGSTDWAGNFLEKLDCFPPGFFHDSFVNYAVLALTFPLVLSLALLWRAFYTKSTSRTKKAFEEAKNQFKTLIESNDYIEMCKFSTEEIQKRNRVLRDRHAIILDSDNPAKAVIGLLEGFKAVFEGAAPARVC